MREKMRRTLPFAFFILSAQSKTIPLSKTMIAIFMVMEVDMLLHR